MAQIYNNLNEEPQSEMNGEKARFKFKAGVHVKAVLTSFNTAFLPISRSRFKRHKISLFISLTTVWRFCVNFWVIFGHFGKEIFFLKG